MSQKSKYMNSTNKQVRLSIQLKLNANNCSLTRQLHEAVLELANPPKLKGICDTSSSVDQRNTTIKFVTTNKNSSTRIHISISPL